MTFLELLMIVSVIEAFAIFFLIVKIVDMGNERKALLKAHESELFDDLHVAGRAK